MISCQDASDERERLAAGDYKGVMQVACAGPMGLASRSDEIKWGTAV